MINDVYLRDGEGPPEIGDWVMVTQTAGKFDIQTVSRGTIGHQTGLFPLSQATQRARIEAYRLGLSHIYVKGVAIAQGS